MSTSTSRLPRRLLAGALVLTTAGAGFWAGRVTATPQAAPTSLPASDVIVTVKQGEVGRSLTLNTTVTQARVPVATNTLTGVVTQVPPAGTVAQGGVLYRVANVPVRAVQGSMPFYRALAQDTKGTDVRQLSEALVAAKLLDAPRTTYDTTMTGAVKKWQQAAGAPVTGTIALGELVAVAKLPAAVSVDTKLIRPGATLAGGEAAVLAPAGEPEFTMVLGAAQVPLVPTSSTVQVQYESKSWPAKISATRKDADGQTVLVLTAPNGAAVCGTDCAQLAGTAQQTLTCTVQTTKPATGTIVPVSAITTRADATSTVTVVEAGTDKTTPVTVVASQDGMAVVKGVKAGDQVRALAQEPAK